MAEANKMVAVKLTQGLGDGLEAGKVLYLAEDKAQALVDAGLAEHATEEDMAGGDEAVSEEVAEEEAPVIANAVNRLKDRVEKAVVDATTKVMQATKKQDTQLPAEVKAPIFRSNGDFLATCLRGVRKGWQSTDLNKVNAYQQDAARAWNKLGVQCKAPLGINETTQGAGGFLVNPQFSPDVYTIPHGQIDLQMQCEMIDAKSNVYNQRYINESSLANGSIFGGLNVVSTSEGSSFTSSLPAWQNVAFTLQKLGVFLYYTSEVLEDSSYNLENELNEYVNKAFIYGINTQIIQGSTLEGALNAPSLVTVTKSSNDTSWTSAPSTNLTYADLSNIWASVYPDCQTSPKGMWLFHPSLASPLVQMTYTFSGAAPAWGIQYSAEEGLSGQGPLTPYRIFGKPAYPCWACSAPGAAGDILYVDFNTFKLYRKPFRVEISKDFQFGSDQLAVRFVSRLDCKTVFRNKVTGVNGAQQFSAIVTRSAAGT